MSDFPAGSGPKPVRRSRGRAPESLLQSKTLLLKIKVDGMEYIVVIMVVDIHIQSTSYGRHYFQGNTYRRRLVQIIAQSSQGQISHGRNTTCTEQNRGTYFARWRPSHTKQRGTRTQTGEPKTDTASQVETRSEVKRDISKEKGKPERETTGQGKPPLIRYRIFS